ncbi:D-alanyl-D-alanine carboxypeptidase family protein [Agrococcus sp. Ld7]|uniref:D-alanyl-D-alanine carboxypeptidase family protein n=1 Tax=Agrococcus sp. Ld7 TaxID=649148 RepID=UPI00386DAABB
MTVTAVSQRANRTHPLVTLLRALLVLVLLAAIVAGAAVLFAPAPAVAARPLEPTPPALPAATVEWPEQARAAGFGVVGVDGQEDVWQSWGSEEAHPMASVTKLVSVLVVLAEHPIEGDERGPLITLGPDDVAAVADALRENAPVAPVFDGMQVHQRDLIEWALVDSAGNAIWSLANWAFGSMQEFESAAAAWTALHGFDDTVLRDAAGLDARSVSSAEDLTRIALRAVAEPVVLSTLQLESVQIPGIGTAPNTNRLLGVNDIDGGKTGTLRVWGRNLFATAVREVDGVERRIVGVVMGTIAADETDAAMIGMIESVWPNFTTRTIMPAGTAIAEYPVPWGSPVLAVTAADLDAQVFGDQVPTVETTTRSVVVGSPRLQVGEASVAGTETTAEVQITESVPEPDPWWRLTHPATAVGWYFED